MRVDPSPALFERLLTEEAEDRYAEAFGLRGVSPDGQRAFELRLSIASTGPTWVERDLEWTLIAAQRDGRVRVVRSENRWADCTLRRGLSFETPELSMTPFSTTGALGQVSWDLVVGGGLGPIRALPRLAFRRGATQMRVISPATALKFAGPLNLGKETWELDGWVGQRFHLFGPSWPGRMAWVSAHQWEDGELRAMESVKCFMDLGLRTLAVHTAWRHAQQTGSWTRPQDWEEPIGVLPDVVQARDMSARAEGWVAIRHRTPEGGTAIRRWAPFAHVALGEARSSTAWMEVWDDQADDPSALPADWWSARHGVFEAGF